MNSYLGVQKNAARFDAPIELSVQDELCRFHEEVLSRGAEAALPHNLSDGWLRRLRYCIEDGGCLSVAIMAILAILASRRGISSSTSASVSKEDLAVYITRYHAELAIEENHRNTGLSSIARRSTPF